MKRHQLVVILLSAGVGMAACGGKQDASSKGAATPATTGKIVTVGMVSDASGNFFKPADFEVHRGDVIRFTITVGVHNVNFLPDSNPGKKNLPKASDLLQLPGQTYDLAVDLEPGNYYYQCDAHAALGMKGHLKVDP